MNIFEPIIIISSLIILLVIFSYLSVSLWVWSLYFAIILGVCQVPIWSWAIFGVVTLIFNIPQLRQRIITTYLVKAIAKLKLLPKISDTERAAIEAGNVWVDGEYFSGKPNLQRLLNEPYPEITLEIRDFLDNQVEQVCQMATDWSIHQRQDLPPQVWQYLKQERFFGMMIPQEYGGLGFSNLAYSSIMNKLASRSFTHTATVGVTNSLGPAKLLLRYGTAEQKNYYLPRLARGEEIPCFALTEPKAGSDAASITAEGIVFRGEDGELYLRLNWNKRYITLSTIATLMGLAFKLRDPDNLLGKGVDVGITCALIPTNIPGVIINRRHDPMGVPFYNSPTVGQDVVIPVGKIIGGVEQAGQGWKMLMQSLAAGRGISFPATCTGIAKLVTRVTGAYSQVRKQFGLNIGRFEGIEEPLARIGGLTYLMEAARLYTVGAVDQGEQPAVISAIAKYNFTELSRQIINDGMDILGGAGICRGPRNLLANIYSATPIPITVEGANILTRTMIIFGQGLIRSHPYAYQEITALENSDAIAFDNVFWHHLGSIVSNGCRTLLLSLTRGYLATSPVSGATAKYWRKLAWSSAAFGFLTDLAMIRLGGNLKRREKLTGRFADVLSWMYLGTATLRRFEAEGCQSEDLPLVDWSMQYSFAQIQQAFNGIYRNLSLPLLGIISAWSRLNPIGVMPSDKLGGTIARIMQTTGKQRDNLTKDIYVPTNTDEALGRLEKAFILSVQADDILKKIKTASNLGTLPKKRPNNLVRQALEAGIISLDEVALLTQAESVRDDAVQVDSFSLSEYKMAGVEINTESPDLLFASLG
ncbi:acyl-CoA dehydrogenase [Xenococcus sp. PCC 7305]|uniref:acyl-CoA dehydrogenase n=1 Tax=Xenococcus sp. PCC 7305 TaxID=102125 RepID=UPI0002ACC685|nr:acyl-CoA dehydrogenase [Xenococcus sp. PCC 7305]ELS03698.1 acyl-CoA dehydrogenase [Xenococcus sp. PCC 7305]